MCALRQRDIRLLASYTKLLFYFEKRFFDILELYSFSLTLLTLSWHFAMKTFADKLSHNMANPQAV